MFKNIDRVKNNSKGIVMYPPKLKSDPAYFLSTFYMSLVSMSTK